MSAEVELRMLEGSEFQTAGAAMLKPWEAKAKYALCLVSLRLWLESGSSSSESPTPAICSSNGCDDALFVWLGSTSVWLLVRCSPLVIMTADASESPHADTSSTTSGRMRQK